MRVLHAYAMRDPARLVFEEAPVPAIGPDDALLRVVASGVSPGELDWPGAWLDQNGSPRVPPIIPGHEVAGTVHEVGSHVEGLSVGEEVFGFIDVHRDGGDAEYVAVRADELVPKPATLTPAQASTVPLSALTAWQALFEHGSLERGQQVLIHGGAGGVGSFAVQFAHWRGARVVAAGSSRDGDLVRSLGADDVIDYRATPFEDIVADLDLVVDTVGGDTWERSTGVIRPGGRLVSIAVPRPPDRDLTDGRRALWFVVRSDTAQLKQIGELIDAGNVRPLVAGTVPLSRGAEAYGPGAKRSAPGKLVLTTMDEDWTGSGSPSR